MTQYVCSNVRQEGHTTACMGVGSNMMEGHLPRTPALALGYHLQWIGRIGATAATG